MSFNDSRDELADLQGQKIEVLEEWRDMLQARTIRQAHTIGEQRIFIDHLRKLITDLLEGKYDDRPEKILEDALPQHPELVDSWKAPALHPAWSANGHLATFPTFEEAEAVAAAYYGSDPHPLFGGWNTRIGAKDPNGDAQFWSQLFLAANPGYRPATASDVTEEE